MQNECRAAASCAFSHRSTGYVAHRAGGRANYGQGCRRLAQFVASQLESQTSDAMWNCLLTAAASVMFADE